MSAQGLENTSHVRLAPQEMLRLGLQSVAHGALSGQDGLVGGAHGRAGHGSPLTQPTTVLIVELQGRSGRTHPGLGAHEGGQDGLVAGVSPGGLTQQVRGPLVLTGGLQGEPPIAAELLGEPGSPLPQKGQRAGPCSNTVICLVGNRHPRQGVAEVEDLLPLACDGAGSGPLRPVRQVSDVDIRLRQHQPVPVAAALDDSLPHDGAHPGDDDVKRPQGAGRGVVGPQGLNEGAVTHPGVLAAGEHGEQVKTPPAQGRAAPGRKIRQESQAVRGGHGSILPHRREAVLHRPGPAADTGHRAGGCARDRPREGTYRQLTG